jgi:hypothetical protein
VKGSGRRLLKFHKPTRLKYEARSRNPPKTYITIILNFKLPKQETVCECVIACELERERKREREKYIERDSISLKKDFFAHSTF